MQAAQFSAFAYVLQNEERSFGKASSETDENIAAVEPPQPEYMD